MAEPLIKQIDEIIEFKQLSEFINDSDFDEALNRVLKLMVKPDVPFSTVNPLLVQLQAFSAKFRIQAKYHMMFNKSDEGNKKKNVLLTTSEAIDRLVDTLKYLSRKS